MAIESCETSPDHPKDLPKSPMPEIPEELQKELDSPIQEYRTPNIARRSRPFPFGTLTGLGRQTQSPTQDLQSSTQDLQSPTQDLQSPTQDLQSPTQDLQSPTPLATSPPQSPPQPTPSLPQSSH